MTYTNKPKYTVETGPVDAVCYSVQDLGIQDTGKYGKKPQLAIGFEIDQRIEDPESDFNGKRMVKWVTYNWFWNEKSNLVKAFMSWFSVVPTAQELKEGIDIDEWCLEKPCTLNLVQKGDYVNIENIMKANKNNKMEPEISSDPPAWIRTKMIDSGTWVEPGQEPTIEQAPPMEDDLPF